MRRVHRDRFPGLWAGFRSGPLPPRAGRLRCRPAFCFTFRPGFASVPLAEAVTAFVFRSSPTTACAVSADVRRAWREAWSRRCRRWRCRCARGPFTRRPRFDCRQRSLGPQTLPAAQIARQPRALRVQPLRVGQRVHGAVAAGGLPDVAVQAEGSVPCGLLHRVRRHCMADMGLPLRVRLRTFHPDANAPPRQPA